MQKTIDQPRNKKHKQNRSFLKKTELHKIMANNDSYHFPTNTQEPKTSQGDKTHNLDRI